MVTKGSLPTHTFENPADALLADVAIRIQLSPTAYGQAVQRHESIKAWIERADSPLSGLVELFYPQGSMATRSTIASKLRTDEFDIDIVAALSIDADTAPGDVLGRLYRAIKGEAGSRYYEMTKRRTRCVTVHYADGMHLGACPRNGGNEPHVSRSAPRIGYGPLEHHELHRGGRCARCSDGGHGHPAFPFTCNRPDTSSARCASYRPAPIRRAPCPRRGAGIDGTPAPV